MDMTPRRRDPKECLAIPNALEGFRRDQCRMVAFTACYAPWLVFDIS